MEKKYLLISTDGYSISTEFYKTVDEAYAVMRKEYNDTMKGVDDEWLEESFCNKGYANAYTGESVYIWKIVEC